MGVIQVQLPDELQTLIDRQIAEGRVADAHSFMTEAARRFAQDLADKDELAVLVREADADLEAGRYVTIQSAEQAEAWHRDRVARLSGAMATDAD